MTMQRATIFLCAIYSLALTAFTLALGDICKEIEEHDHDHLSPRLKYLLSDLHTDEFYINGTWTTPISSKALPLNIEPITIIVRDSSTDLPLTTVASASQSDVDTAVQSAHEAQPAWSHLSIVQRMKYLERLMKLYNDPRNEEDFALLLSAEMGAPIDFARESQVGSGLYVIESFLDIMRRGLFDYQRTIPGSLHEDTVMLMEPVGVVGMITPWNWPLYQILLKLVPALLMGNTCILKPSELSPLNALLLTNLIDRSGFPPGVFNIINGDGVVGAMLSHHPQIDMMSFTGSTRAGRDVYRASAETFKKMSLELGGKGAFIIFADVLKREERDDDSFSAHDNDNDESTYQLMEEAIHNCVHGCFENSGQSCNAPTRLLVEHSIYDKAIEIATKVAMNVQVKSAHEHGDHLGPVISRVQQQKILSYIQTGIDEGARVMLGGLNESSSNLDPNPDCDPDSDQSERGGYYVHPTLFADCDSSMTIMQEEIFGPVLCIASFHSEEEAIDIANDTNYGLTNYVYSTDVVRRRRMARKLKSGMVEMNGVAMEPGSPFGGMKASGGGREGGIIGLEEFCNVKVITGYWDRVDDE